MTQLTDQAAMDHPAYAGGLRRAIDRAFRDRDAMALYYDGEAIFVRAAAAIAPPDAKLIFIAEWWDDKTVQLRFDGARSEWVNP